MSTVLAPVRLSQREKELVRELLHDASARSRFWLLMVAPFAILAWFGLVYDMPFAVAAAIGICLTTQLLIYSYTDAHRSLLRNVLRKYHSALESGSRRASASMLPPVLSEEDAAVEP